MEENKFLKKEIKKTESCIFRHDLESDDGSGDLLGWTELSAASSPGGHSEAKRSVTGISAEKLLIQMAKEIGAIKNQVCYLLTQNINENLWQSCPLYASE